MFVRNMNPQADLQWSLAYGHWLMVTGLDTVCFLNQTISTYRNRQLSLIKISYSERKKNMLFL